MQLQKYDADIPPGKAFAETRVRFHRDMFLREKGFRIEHRRKGEEAVWSRHGVRYTESEAVEVAME